MQTAPALIPVSLPALEGSADHSAAAAGGCGTEFSLSLADLPKLPRVAGDPFAPELVPDLWAQTQPTAALAQEAGAVRAMCLETVPEVATSSDLTGTGDGPDESTADLALVTFQPGEIAVLSAAVPSAAPAALPRMSGSGTEEVLKSGTTHKSAVPIEEDAVKHAHMSGWESSKVTARIAGPREGAGGPVVVSWVADPSLEGDLASSAVVAPVGRKDTVSPIQVDLAAAVRVGHSGDEGHFAARVISASEPASDAAAERGRISAGGVGAAPQEGIAPVAMSTSGPEAEDKVQDGAGLSKPDAGQPMNFVPRVERSGPEFLSAPQSERPILDGLQSDSGPTALRTEDGARPVVPVALHHKADVAVPAVPSEIVLTAGQGDAGPKSQPGSFWERLFIEMTEEPARLATESGSTGPAPAILPVVPMAPGTEGDPVVRNAFETVRGGQAAAGDAIFALRPVTSRMPAVPAPSLELAGPVPTFADVASDTEIVPEDLGVLPGLPLTSGNPAISAGAISGPANTLPVPQIASQLATALLQGADGATELALSPEELGHVRLRLEPDANNPDRLVVMISFERPETLDLFRRHATELAEALRAAGYAGADIGFGQQGGSETAARRDGHAGDATDFLTEPPLVDAQTPRLMAGTSLDLRL